MAKNCQKKGENWSILLMVNHFLVAWPTLTLARQQKRTVYNRKLSKMLKGTLSLTPVDV